MLQILLNGISTGAVYSLIAIGFALVFNILKFSNFSFGATMTASAFIAYFLVASKGWGLAATLLCSAAAGSLIGLAGELIGFRRILNNHSAPTYFFVSSITLGTLYEGLVTLKTGTNFYVYPTFFETSALNIGNAVISRENLIILAISAVSLAVLAFVIQKTPIGRQIRAASFDRETAKLMGINSTLIIQIVFMISGFFGGLAGCFLGIKYTLTSTLGSMVVKGFISSVIGGLGSLTGAVIGSMLLGIMEAVFLSMWGSGWATIASFALMLIFLLVRPQGIAGSNVQEKA